jgi:hypothetical protein
VDVEVAEASAAVERRLSAGEEVEDSERERPNERTSFEGGCACWRRPAPVDGKGGNDVRGGDGDTAVPADMVRGETTWQQSYGVKLEERVTVEALVHEETEVELRDLKGRMWYGETSDAVMRS